MWSVLIMKTGRPCIQCDCQISACFSSSPMHRMFLSGRCFSCWSVGLEATLVWFNLPATIYHIPLLGPWVSPLTQRGFLSNSQTNASLWIASRLFSLPWHVLVKALKGQWHLQYFTCCKTLFGMMISVNQRTHAPFQNLVSCLPRHHCKAS